MSRQIELLRPSQIEAALSQRSLIYLPLGTIEWHCHHLPVGLDGLTARGLCLGAAEITGVLVWPALYFGTGGDHGDYPWTVMMDGPEEIEALIDKTLSRLETLGVARVVIFSGHFADEQVDMFDRVAARWKGRSMDVRASGVLRLSDPGYSPDHAGLFETTLLAGFWPDTVDLGALSPKQGGEERLDRHDPAHPLWGVMGGDPRPADIADAPRLVQALTVQLASLAGR